MLSPFLSADQSCDEVAARLKQSLASAGLRVIQTFDLTTARLGLQDCACPNHGTRACTCQLVVLFLYESSVDPVTLILHGNDGQTWLSLADQSHHPAITRTISAIQNALKAPVSDGNRPNSL